MTADEAAAAPAAKFEPPPRIEEAAAPPAKVAAAANEPILGLASKNRREILEAEGKLRKGPVAEEATGIFKGAPVFIRGLTGAAEWNGFKGIVTAGPFDNGRYEVTLQMENKQEPKVLSLKTGNFQLDTDALKAYITQKRAEKAKRNPPLEDLSLVWAKGKGLSVKSLTSKTSEVLELEEGKVLLRIDKFGFSHMTLGYLMKGFTRTFGGYHSFYPWTDEAHYRSACWGYATVMESAHPKVAVGTRIYGLVPPSKYTVQRVSGTIAGTKGDPSILELEMENVPYNMRRFQEMEIVEGNEDDPVVEDWRIIAKEVYKMAFYMDEQLLVETGMINSVIISCASCKTALALAYCLRMREMRYVVGFTSKEHLDFVKSTDLYHDVFCYEDVDKLPTDHTVVYMDFKCDGELRQRITLKMGTNLMYNMVLGPAVFQKRMKDQVFEKRAREVIFNEATWRERRRMVAEVTKTGRNEKLKYSYKSFVERMRQYMKVRRATGVAELTKMYDSVYSNTASPSEVFVCSLHGGEDEAAVDEIFAA
mmetsp:Transcript_73181/g.148601  ORF Transcript_73181/g.148601 Transcript_73181/m.148601 type:complete len:535 (+) Transcript_73181:149-1753(+)